MSSYSGAGHDPRQVGWQEPAGQAAYGQPVQPTHPAYYVTAPYAAPAGTNGLAVAALVLGILWVYWIGSILAVIFGHVALSQINKRYQSGKGLAIAGLVLGWIGVGVLLFVIIVSAAVGSA